MTVLFFVTLVDVCLLLDAVFLEYFLVGFVGAMVDALATATNRNETRTATTERLAFAFCEREPEEIACGGKWGEGTFLLGHFYYSIGVYVLLVLVLWG